MCSIRMNKNIFPLEDFKTDLGKGRQTLCSGRACWGLQQKNKRKCKKYKSMRGSRRENVKDKAKEVRKCERKCKTKNGE